MRADACRNLRRWGRPPYNARWSVATAGSVSAAIIMSAAGNRNGVSPYCCWGALGAAFGLAGYRCQDDWAACHLGTDSSYKAGNARSGGQWRVRKPQRSAAAGEHRTGERSAQRTIDARVARQPAGPGAGGFYPCTPALRRERWSRRQRLLVKAAGREGMATVTKPNEVRTTLRERPIGCGSDGSLICATSYCLWRQHYAPMPVPSFPREHGKNAVT